MKKLLSFLIHSKNDDYHNDLHYRMQKALDTNLYFINKLGHNYSKLFEFIYVDWGSEKKLSEILYVHKNFKNSVKFINVNKKITERYSKNFANFFNPNISYNVGILKSNAKFILATGCDQFFNKPNLENLINFFSKEKIDDKKIYFLPRKIISVNTYSKNFDNDYYAKYLVELNSSNFSYKAHTFYEGGGFSTIFSRKNFLKLKGYSEKLKPGEGLDIDISLRSSLLNSKRINLENFGIYMYKFPPLPGSNRDKLLYKKSYRQKFITKSKELVVNKNDWGLKSFKLNDTKPKKISSSYLNYNNFKEQLTIKRELKARDILKNILKLNNINLELFFDLKNIFLILLLSNKEKINNLVEFGFSVKYRLSLIGNIHDNLKITVFDYDPKNFTNRNHFNLSDDIFMFSEKNYGVFCPLTSTNLSYFYNSLNNIFKETKSNLLIINYKNNNYCDRFISNLFKKKWVLNNFKYIIILNGTNNQRYKIEKYKYNLKLINLNKRNFLVKNLKLCRDKSNNFYKNRYTDSYFIGIFLISYIQKKFSLFFRKLRSVIYSFI
tara:strand:+ start:28685 stop:30337 length:1653 start_codon:yes stop_codon:yes gene_type:complete